MGAWYTIGILVGIGAAAGILTAALVPRFVVAALVAAAAGIVIGVLGATPVVAGALRRGGTRGGTAALVGAGALVAAGLAFVPVVGYLEAAVLPLLGLRLRRREPDR